MRLAPTREYVSECVVHMTSPITLVQLVGTRIKDNLWKKRISVTCDCEGRGFIAVADNGGAEPFEVLKLYNAGYLQDGPITGNLASYIALLHICGPEALSSVPPPVEVESWTVWRAASLLRSVLKREGATIVCSKLGKRYPTRAA